MVILQITTKISNNVIAVAILQHVNLLLDAMHIGDHFHHLDCQELPRLLISS